jgi:hypothetical protein
MSLKPYIESVTIELGERELEQLVQLCYQEAELLRKAAAKAERPSIAAIELAEAERLASVGLTLQTQLNRAQDEQQHSRKAV